MLGYYSRRRFARVLEIGVDMGGTLYQWMKHNHSLHPVICAVDAVDWPGCSGLGTGGKVQEWQAWAEHYNVALYPILGDSHEPNIVDEVRSHAPYDWIFVDGDHSYEGVKQDFENYAPMLSYRGVMVFHDIVPHTRHKGIEVWRFWEELKARYPLRYVEFVANPKQWQCGLGVLFASPEGIA